MVRAVAVISGILLISILYSQKDRSSVSLLNTYLHYDRIYHAAEKLSLDPNYNEKTEELETNMNRQALEGFRNLLPALEKEKEDSLKFHSYFRIATLLHYFDSLKDAHWYYNQTIDLEKKIPGLQDSFLFKPYLFSGSIYYALGQFDSATNYFKQAERITGLYAKALDGSNRLYNTLGAVYYETGNYRQAKNYFEKALAVLPFSDPFFTDLQNNYYINLAATYNKLENFSKADSIYRRLLPSGINRNEILHNMGTIQLNTGAIPQALAFFRQVRYNNNKIVRLYNDIGYSFSNLGLSDSAHYFFTRAIEENLKWYGKNKNAAHGMTLKYMGDELTDHSRYPEAARKYQQAIMQFAPEFTDSIISSNPVSFTGIFSYIQLFHALVAKADLFEKWYALERKTVLLENSLKAYQAAYQLADHVEYVYDSDEARLFLNKIKHTVHGRPIEISLQLFDLTDKSEYLEAAYFFDQQNKASVLSFNIEEAALRKNKNKGPELERDSAVRASITRLSLKAGETTDTVLLKKLSADVRDNEIELGKLRQNMNDDRVTSRIPRVKDLQQKLDASTGLVSYHLSDTSVLLLYLSSNSFEYKKVKVGQLFYSSIDSLKQGLNDIDSRNYPLNDLSKILYQSLITPIEKLISTKNRLIIIPDDELHYLPFEVLKDKNDHYLLEKYSIQYQYSTALLATDNKKQGKNNSILAFAPFVSNSYVKDGHNFNSLPATAEEVRAAGGKNFIDEQATKKNFLDNASQYQVLHLATHATVNNDDPLRSFIAFYPGIDYKLYAREIYDLNLEATRMVILSACETGSGALVKGEGLMSLSRAFAYAGCDNVITSLWKAEDKTTALITKQLYHYLDKGFTRDRALQQSKLDLLQNKDLDPRYRSPRYWAHIIYIGSYEPSSSYTTRWWIITGIIISLLTLFILQRRSKFTSSASSPGKSVKY